MEVVLNRFQFTFLRGRSPPPLDELVPAGREEILHFQGLARVVQPVREVGSFRGVHGVGVLQIQDVRVDIGNTLQFGIEDGRKNSAIPMSLG